MDTRETRRPNILLILVDQQRYPTVYEDEDLKRFEREELRGQQWLKETSVTFRHHYVMSAACTPSRASLLTGHYPPLHGVSQTDGLAKDAYGDDMFWLAPDGLPTMGDYFRAGGYRTFYKGKWHASHAHLDDPEGEGYLQSMEPDGTPNERNVTAYLQADLLDEFGFAEWVGPDPHGLGKRNTGTMKDPFTADETIALLQRLDETGDEQPWLTVCSFLNPHDIALFGMIALAQGLHYHTGEIPHIPSAPTHDEDMSTKPACHQSYNEAWGGMLAPQPYTETHRRFYYQMHLEVDRQMERVLEALRATKAYANTIIIFSADHGDTLGAHGGMHQKWHNAYEETIHVPFVVHSPLLGTTPRDVNALTNHADLLPTMLGLAGIDEAQAASQLVADHTEVRALVGRDLSALVLGTAEEEPSDPVLFMTDDEISEGNARPGSPFQRWARRVGTYDAIVQPNHVETVVTRTDVDGETHTVKLSRYHDNQQFWAMPGELDVRLQGRKRLKLTEPSPDEYELYDLTTDPLEQHNLAHSSVAQQNGELLSRMVGLLAQELAAKRLVPSVDETPGYRPPVVP